MNSQPHSDLNKKFNQLRHDLASCLTSSLLLVDTQGLSSQEIEQVAKTLHERLGQLVHLCDELQKELNPQS